MRLGLIWERVTDVKSLRFGEDCGDAEPSLACAEGRDYQVVWCVGGDDDWEMA